MLEVPFALFPETAGEATGRNVVCSLTQLTRMIVRTTTGCLRKVRRIYNLYISGCIGDRAPNEVPSESLFKDILFEWESTTRGHCTGEREGMFVMSSITSTREDQYSEEPHFHLDCKFNGQNFRLWSHGKPDVVAEALF